MPDDTKTEQKTLLGRLRWAETTLHAMMHGEKPAVDTRNPSESWLYEQMTRMHKAGFLCEEPESYMMLPGEDPAALTRLKGNTVREPMPKQLTSEYKDLRDVAHAERRSVFNFKVLGADVAYRYSRDPLLQAGDADAFVLTRGGLVELYQWCRFLRAQVERRMPEGDRHFIAQNDDGFWNPMLKAFEGLHRKTGRHHVTDTRHDTAETIDTLLDDKSKTRPPRWSGEQKILQPGSQVFFVTGNRKKVLDYKKVFRRRGTDVQSVWFQQKFDKPEGADEMSYSYVGNLTEKIEKFYLHIRDHYGTAGFRAALAEKGYDLDKAVLWFDDSGIELEDNLTGGEEFANTAAYRMNSYKKHGPGAELKNAINAMQNHAFDGARGIRGMMKRMEAASARIKQERIDAGVANPDVSLRTVDRNCIAIVPLRQLVLDIEAGLSFAEVLEKTPMHFFQASSEHTVVFAPRPDAPAVDTKNFLVPHNDPDGRTQAENPQFVAHHSSIAQVVKAAARALGFDKYEGVSRDLTRVFARAAGEAWRIGTQHSLAPFAGSHGLGKKMIKGMSGFYAPMHAKRRYDMESARDHKIVDESGKTMTMRTPLNNFHDFTRRADGFVLTPDGMKAMGEDNFWLRTFTFFSLIVGRQINDKSVTSKPLLVMDCPTWKPYLNLLATYAGGLIPELPDDILDAVVKDKNDLNVALNKAFGEYRPDQVPEYRFRENGLKCPDDMFCVTVYCSASTTDYPMKMWARDFAFDCAGLGFAIKNGGGTGPDGLMIETSEGARLVREQFDKFIRKQGYADGAPETHVASIQCEDTAQEEGLCKFNDYWAVYPTIYQRMHELQRADAEVVLPGGAGTFQEIAASVLMRKAGIYPSVNRPLVIINHEGIYDPFLNMIPLPDFKRYNIHVVDTAEQALDLLIQARAARQMEPDLPYTREEYAACKKAFMRSLRRQEPDLSAKNFTIGRP